MNVCCCWQGSVVLSYAGMRVASMASPIANGVSRQKQEEQEDLIRGSALRGLTRAIMITVPPLNQEPAANGYYTCLLSIALASSWFFWRVVLEYLARRSAFFLSTMRCLMSWVSGRGTYATNSVPSSAALETAVGIRNSKQ